MRHADRETSTTDRAEAAERLRELADEIETGVLDLDGTSLDVPEQLEYGFDVGREEDVEGVAVEVAVTLAWVDAEGDIEDAETPHGTSLVEPEDELDDLELDEL